MHPKSDIKEVISVNKSDNIQNAAFRIMTYKTVFQKTLSTKIGVYFCDYTDIHNKSDYLKVKKTRKVKDQCVDSMLFLKKEKDYKIDDGKFLKASNIIAHRVQTQMVIMRMI